MSLGAAQSFLSARLLGTSAGKSELVRLHWRSVSLVIAELGECAT